MKNGVYFVFSFEKVKLLFQGKVVGEMELRTRIELTGKGKRIGAEGAGSTEEITDLLMTLIILQLVVLDLGILIIMTTMTTYLNGNYYF